MESLFDSVMKIEKISEDDRAYSSEAEFLSELTAAAFSRILMKLKDRGGEKTEIYADMLKGSIPVVLPDEEAIRNWRSCINMRIEATRSAGRQNKLLRLLDRTAASGFEAELLAFLVNCRFDNRCMEAAKEALSLENEPDILSLYGLFSDTVGRNHFSYGDCCRALSYIFCDLAEKEDILKEHVSCDDRLLALATGQSVSDPAGIESMDPEGVKELLFRERELEFAWNVINDGENPVLLLYGAEGTGKRMLSFHAASALKRKLTICTVPDPVHTEAGMGAAVRAIRYAVRESMVNDSILLIRGLKHEDIAFEYKDSSAGHSSAFRVLMDRIAEIRKLTPGIIVAADTEEEPSVSCHTVPCFMPPYVSAERLVFWRNALDVSGDEREEILIQTAGEFELTPGQIHEAAEKYLHMEGDDSRDPGLFRKKLHRACYSVIGHELAKKAKLVEAAFTWDELKLPAKDKQLLHDIVHAVQLRSVIMQDWNFKSRLPYGNGITVLFSGPPGTGKTMAAEVLANELQMELYKIDMSRVLDKYVGETEKHIREIFDLARKGNFILFFDEADAIFNKRMDAKDANERFANIESSMLLQSIEEYDGVAILATNKMSAMDPAFMRRFRFFIQFTEPDEEIAYSIWKSVFPPEAPLDDRVNFRELAHVFVYTGAIIKNVAIQAAYMAAGEKSSITMLHILKAVKREMEKNQRVMTREELGPLSYLYDELMKEREMPHG